MVQSGLEQCYPAPASQSPASLTSDVPTWVTSVISQGFMLSSPPQPQCEPKILCQPPGFLRAPNFLLGQNVWLLPLYFPYPAAESPSQPDVLNVQEVRLVGCCSPRSRLNDLECAPELDSKRAECPSCHQWPTPYHLEPLGAHRDFLVRSHEG